MSATHSSQDTTLDGRRRKGERRRRLLLDATMRVIEQGGVSAVTQRAVAREAELPPSAVMYYFPSIDELLVAALTACNDRCLDDIGRFSELDDATALAHVAAWITECAHDSRGHVAAEYELYLLAGRRPEMRPEIGRWTNALDALMQRFVADPIKRAGVTAAVDGLILRSFVCDEPPDADEVLQILQRLTRCAG